MSNSPKIQTSIPQKDLPESKIFQESPGKRSNKNSTQEQEESKNETSSEHMASKHEDNEAEQIQAEEEANKMLAELTYKCQFHDMEKLIPYGLTFDDVLLIPQYSRISSRHEIELNTKFSRNVPLKIPLVSSPMDTVTEYDMAVAMARQGGLGIIHRFMSIKDQAAMVIKVKNTEAHVLSKPISIHPDMTIKEVRSFVKKLNLSTFIVINEENSDWIPYECSKTKQNSVSTAPTLAGILTKRDLNYAQNDEQKVVDLMTPREKMVVYENICEQNLPTPIQLVNKMKEKRVEKIVLLGENNTITGLVCLKDCQRKEYRPWGNFDSYGRLYVGAAVGAKDDYLERAQALIDAGVDVLIVDVANGHSQLCVDAVRSLKKKFPSMDVVAGSIATGEGAELLIKAGVDGIRCGIGI